MSAIAAVISKTVRVYDYITSTSIVISVFIPELQMSAFLGYFLVVPALNIAYVLVFLQSLTLPGQ
jgi:hypothetical protein